MKERIVTQYSCDFCKKKLIAKSAMEKHEKWCMKNPANKQACYEGCVHLEYKELMLSEGDCWHPPYYKDAPYCSKLAVFLYNLRAVQKKLPEKYPETFEEHIPMPKDCEHFNNGVTKDFQDFINAAKL